MRAGNWGEGEDYRDEYAAGCERVGEQREPSISS